MTAQSLESQRDAWLEALRVRGRAASTLSGRQLSLERFFEQLRRAGIADLREVTPAQVAAYQAWLMKPGRYAVASVIWHLTSVCLFFRHLQDTDAILCDPCSRVVLPKQPRRLPQPVLTRRQARQILGAPEPQTPTGIRDRALLELFYSTGIRLEEMARLTLHDADSRTGFLRVTRGKGNRDRVVPIGATACAALRRYLREVRSPWLRESRLDKLGTSRQPASSNALWLSPIPPHQPLKKEAIAWIVCQRSRQRVGKSISPHQWRHAFATHLVSAGANLVHVQRLLGHRSLKTTQIYARVTIPEIKRTFRRAHPRARMILGKDHPRERLRRLV